MRGLLKLIRGKKPEKEKISDKVLGMIYDEQNRFDRECEEIKLSFSDYHGLLYELKKSGQWPFQQHDTAGSSFLFFGVRIKNGA